MNQETESQSSSSQFVKTDGGKTKSNAIALPSITLPKGGGAIRGIDEKFSVNAVNGTVHFSIALPFSPARGTSPALSLSYNSGAGNGVFGLGWALSLSSIKRKTENGLPQYLDDPDSDTFLFSEAEDLVPEFKKEPDGSFSIDPEGNYVINEKDSPDGLFTIRFYKPRIEGLFARIERWSSKTSPELKWRVMTKENLTILFGWSSASRIYDPKDDSKIFEWLPEFVFDDKGNCSHYLYKKENEQGIDHTLLCNRNRIKNGIITYTNLYLEKVLYGNKMPYKQLHDPFPGESDYMFQTVFDFGDYDTDAPHMRSKNWIYRKDPFSYYKSGFEIRTTRLCQRILLFHFFDELPGASALIKALNFQYNSNSPEEFNFLKSVTACGYIKKADGTYTCKNLPPLEFEYQKHVWNDKVNTIPSEQLVHAPSGLNEPQYQFVDLFNEGLTGILSEQAQGLYYKHNLGQGHFEQAKLVSPKPSFSGLGVQSHLLDLEADGGKQLVTFSGGPKGFFELSAEGDWQAFQAFKHLPNINMQDPNTRMLDLNGDGMPEILIADDNVFTWYESEGRRGFKHSRQNIIPFNEETGPRIVFSEPQQNIFLADMSGDGLTDLVRIRNGEICYWPNLGYGRFGAKITMDNAPIFDYPDQFNSSFILLADIDGSGTTDIIYQGKNKISCWMNLNGNSFSTPPFEIDPAPEINSQTKITVADLLGNGLPCIVWSSSLAKDARAPLQYIDLMNSKKPHLMIQYKNNLGKEVSLEYTPSTKFYVEDKLAGKSCSIKLHFPVHCISKTETKDTISGYRFVSTYQYHHGYYDHAEKEFRGFGMVEKSDAEHFEHWAKGNAGNIVERELHQEPVITKSWFHTGAFLDRGKILNQFAHEYWYEEMAKQGFTAINCELTLTEAQIIAAPGISSIVIEHLSTEEWREALRACKGMALRSEVFAQDAPLLEATSEQRKRELTPYAVSTHNCVIELLQPRGKNKHAVFVVKESEAVTYSYERHTEDPRIAHNLKLKIDKYGNVLESAAVVYPRMIADSSLPAETQQAQNRTTIIYSKNDFTSDVMEDDHYRLRRPSETKTYELKGVDKAGPYYALSDFDNILSHAAEVAYHLTNTEPAPGSLQKRLIEHVRTIYLKNDLTGPLSLHQLESKALRFESYQLAYTPELAVDIFGHRVNDALLLEGEYTHSEGDNNWWIRSGTTLFIDEAETVANAQERFYLPTGFIDPYGAQTRIKYDDKYYLYMEETKDALGNKACVDLFNYRTLWPQRMKDINNNITEVITDELGLVKAMALMGKGNEADDLSGLFEFTATGEKTQSDDFFNAPSSDQLVSTAKELLQKATVRFVYDLEVYRNTGKPVVAASIVREDHFLKNNDSPVQISLEYSNGLGQVVMKKAQTEPGLAQKVEVGPDDTYVLLEVDTSALEPKQLRWIGTGRTVLNNKGNAVKQYEPYFSVTHRYEDLKELVETGVTPVLYYDALGRLIKTVMSEGTFSKIEFDSWKQSIYDRNDTILKSTWYHNRTNHLIDAELIQAGKDPGREKIAAEQAAKHADTPATLYFDSLGRPVLSIEHNKHSVTTADEFYHTKVNLDTEGNLRGVTDARSNLVVQYKYDMLGNKVYQNSMDAGQRWLLVNILGQPLRNWDERNHEFRYFYDILHRPIQSKVFGGDSDTLLDHIFERIFYGEAEPNPELKNLRGKTVRHYDTGGLVETPAYDFKGNPQSTTRTLSKNYKTIVNWIDANLASDLEPVGFTFVTEMDALGRLTRQTAPDGSVITSSYNEAGLLNGEAVAHADPSITTTYIKDIEYNEKGQRQTITCGNDVITNYYYDKETFRLKRLESQRANNDPLQDWHYTYDPVGNITHIEDKNSPAVFFDNQKVTSIYSYTYDALYRLVEATGRENNISLPFDSKDNWIDYHFSLRLNPGDPMVMRNYSQNYQYDAVGNIVQMRHQAVGNTWTRNYSYEAYGNRLISTQIGANTYLYPHHLQHGYMTAMPHLEEIGWSFKEEIIKTIRQRRTDGGTPETTYYQYDGQGQRIRKITEKQADAGITPARKEERIYLAGYELYRKYTGTDAGLERISLSLMDRQHRFAIIETRNNVDDGTEKHLVRYQLSNHLGSACLELDGTSEAKVISYEEYHPYGTTAYLAQNTAIKSAAKRYRYTGMERDEESGLGYHSARYYLPWLGRWASADPPGIRDGLNVYRYVRNNPLCNNDPSGMCGCDPEIQSCQPLSWEEEVESNCECIEPYTPAPQEEYVEQPVSLEYDPGVGEGVSQMPLPVSTPPAQPEISTPASAASSEDSDWELFDNPIWNATTNNAASGATGLFENVSPVTMNMPNFSNSMFRVGGLRGWDAALRAEDALSLPASRLPSVFAPSVTITGSRLPMGMSRASAVLAPLGVVSNAMSFEDAISREGPALERGGEAMSSVLGFFSSSVGTLALTGAGLEFAGATTVGGALSTGAAALGPAAAVAGSGAAGYAAGRLLDEGVGGLMNVTGASDAIDSWRGISYAEGQHGDYSISGIAAGGVTFVDQGFVSAMRSVGAYDESSPAYTQTLGWWLADHLPSWMQ